MIPLVQAVQEDHPPKGGASNSVTSDGLAMSSTEKKVEPDSKVYMQLTGKIALQLQLENTDETVQVRHCGETIEIRFNDGKAIHLPIKVVA